MNEKEFTSHANLAAPERLRWGERFLAVALLAFAPVGAWASAGTPLPDPPPNGPRAAEIKRAFECRGEDAWTFRPGSIQAARVMRAAPGAPWDLRRAGTLRVEARVVRAARQAVRLRWVIESRVSGRYAAVRTVTVPSAGAHAEAAVALAPAAAALAPVGHQRPWDALSAAEVLRIELHAETSGTGRRPVTLDLRSPRLTWDARPQAPPEPRLLDVSLEAPPPDIEAVATLTFRLDPLPDDPFAARGEGDARVKLGGGGKADGEALAFLDQDYFTVREGRARRLVPVGAPRYRAHLPRWPKDGVLSIVSGARRWTFSVKALPRARRAADGTSGAAREGGGQAPEALVQGAARWRVPLEVPLRRAPDAASKGLWESAPAAWRFAPRAPGQWAVCPAPSSKKAWRPMPFWNARWGRFGGARRPGFTLARRMDARLAQAAAAGRRQPMILMDGETLSRQGTFNWQSHPLNAAQGGPLNGPGAVLNSEEGVAFCRRAARYAVARWGYSRAVSSFWLTVTLNAPAAPDWHARLAASAKTWPPIASGKKALFSLHPMTREPRKVVDVGGIDLSGRAAGGGWRLGEPLPARLALLLEDQGSGEGPMSASLELSAAGRNASVCAIKPYRLASVSYRRSAPDDFFAADALLFDVWLPPDAPADLRAGVHLRDRDGLWFQTLLPGLLRPGDWSTCLLDLSGRNAQGLKAIGHLKEWTTYSRSRIREIGLHVYSTHPERRLKVRFARVRGVRFDRAARAPKRRLALLGRPPARLKRGERWEAHLKINRAYANPFDPQQVDLAALIVAPSGRKTRVPAFLDQPCRRREERPGGAEIVEPVGAERWTVRYRALEEGPHKVRFELREGGKYRIVEQRWVADRRFTHAGKPLPPLIRNKDDWMYRYEQSRDGRRRVERVVFQPGKLAAALELPGAAFTVSGQAPGWHGFVRKSADDRHLCFDDGRFYYALGPCLRSPSDNRLPYDDPKWNAAFLRRLEKRGTYQYDEYLEAFEKAGINWTRVWMCSWWGALQWRRDWPGYQGLGRYNLLNAWRMDHVLDTAEKRGIYISLCLANHGTVSHVIDTEWKHNPYNARLGGPLSEPREFFTRASAKAAHRNMLRYIVARWGASPAVLAWDLFSELEFSDEYRPSIGQAQRGQPDRPAPNIEAWHREMARYLKAIDPNRHLVSTHFSHPLRGAGTLSLPGIDVATSNAYSAFDELAGGRKDAAAALSDFWSGSAFGHGVFRGMRMYRKPVLVQEQGRHWMGVEWKRGRKIQHNSRDQLDADLHAGLWGSLVQPLAGATGYWWWLHVHFDERYAEYRALAEYLKGEDLRPGKGEAPLKPERLTVLSAGRPLLGRALRSSTRAYAWIYHRLAPHRTRGLPTVSGAKVVLEGLAPGGYRIEFWDTHSGRRIGTVHGVAERGRRAPGRSGTLAVRLPPLEGDLALKVKSELRLRGGR